MVIGHLEDVVHVKSGRQRAIDRKIDTEMGKEGVNI